MSTNPARHEAERLATTLLAAANTALQAAAVREQARQLRDVAGLLFGAAQPGAAQPGPARSRTTEPGTAQPGPGQPAAGAEPSGHRFATGSAECCVCPVCRLITALRDPDPQLVERLVDGAGDLAVGLAGVLRAFGGDQQPGPDSRTAPSASDDGRSDRGARSAGRTRPGPAAPAARRGPKDDPWRTATTATQVATQAAAPRTTGHQAAGSTAAPKVAAHPAATGQTAGTAAARKVAKKVAPRKAATGPATGKAPGGADTTGNPA